MEGDECNIPWEVFFAFVISEEERMRREEERKRRDDEIAQSQHPLSYRWGY